MEAEIDSQKMDYGDRLYMVGSINKVSYEEIDKPERKVEYKNIKVSEHDVDKVLDLLKQNGIEVVG